MNKPPYRVPSMAEISALPWNGFKVASTFSGCGGSSLGYRMAGFQVVWANEFIPAARESYRANAAPYTVLDGRDIRTIQPGDILSATGLAEGELDLFDGSPPCASFSTAGKRAAGWGQVKSYSDTKQRTDDLFFEYARLIRGLRPKVFVAENVSGLVKGQAKGYFKLILQALKDCGYTVAAKVLDAQWLGVPQARQRLIFCGVRNDLGLSPAFPTPLPFRYSIREALPHVLDIQYGDPNHHKNPGTNFERGVIEDAATHPCRTVKQSTGGISGSGHLVRVIHDTGGLYGKGDVTDRPCPTITVGVNSLNSTHFKVEIEPEADISRYAVGKEWDKLKPGEQSQKYFQLVRPDPDAACPTITASGGTASLASVTHPTQKRKFTIQELKALCGFPPDFVLAGTYAQQWERLGRAVPPVMMSHIAAAVRDNILRRIQR